MVYLKEFNLLDDFQEHIILETERRNIFNTYYPLHLFSSKDFSEINFDTITIFYGGNGSGKSTLLNIISEKVGALRKTSLEKGPLFNLYVKKCNYHMRNKPNEIKAITSDDVFDYLLDVRSINAGVHRRKEELSKDYLEAKFERNTNSFQNYEELKDLTDARKMTMSKFVRSRLANNNIKEQSNGESALMFWEQEINEESVYILDEPENSLSAENQIKLKQFIEESARFFHCQFIISTHSPFLLALEEAKVYDLDSLPVVSKPWTELSNVRNYYNFFKEKEKEFK